MTQFQLLLLFRRYSKKLMSLGIKLIPAIFAMTLVFSHGGTALAYNRNNAVSYADQWALSRNGAYPSFGSDCTNFASQALTAGGYSQVLGDGNVSNDNNWWGYHYRSGSVELWTNSHSWSVAPDQYNFQLWHNPGGFQEAVVTASDSAFWANFDNVNMVGGDELFFDWGKGEGISHVAFQVWAGYSQYMPAGQSFYGDLSDQHVTDHYHVSWSHNEVNGDWPTTTIYEIHIDDGN